VAPFHQCGGFQPALVVKVWQSRIGPSASTADYGGTIFPVTFIGAYSVKPNCTGSLTADAGSNGIIHRDLVIVDSGKEVELVSTDAGLVISGYTKKQHTE
jgi:hypothetical protein